MAEVFSAPPGIELKLFSETGDLFATLSDNNMSGEILNVSLNVFKFGGLDSFSFQLPRNNDLPISKNTEVFFYVNSELWYNGFVKEAPQPDQYEPVITIQGSGFYKRLTAKTINETYTSETLEDIIDDISTTYLGSDIGVFYDSLKIDVPALSNIDIEFKDKNLLQVFKRILEVANYDYENSKYIFYVDNDKEIVFEQLDDDSVQQYFEGYQYQSPEVSEDTSGVINKILAYRTKVASSSEVEYVATYEDVPSQSEIGLFERKIVFPDYMDSTTVNNICSFILQRYKDPQKRIAIKDLELSDKISFGEYTISNRRDDYWFLGAKCDTLDGWDISAFINSTVELASERLLTRKQILKFTVGAGSIGESIEYTLPESIPFATLGRLYIYFDTNVASLTIIFTDEQGAESKLTFESAEDELLVDDSTTEDLIEVNNSFVSDSLTVNYPLSSIADQWIKYVDEIETGFTDIEQALDVFDGFLFYELDVDDGSGQDTLVVSGKIILTEIVKIKVLITTEQPSVFYIDRIDLRSNAYNSNRLQLEEIMYSLRSSQLAADLNFGEKEDNILDELNSKVEDGSTALEIFSKR